MLTERLNREINVQINEEIYSAYLYLSMAAWFAGKNLPGFEHWMRIQVQEELSHASKFFGFVHERGGSVTLEAIKRPDHEWASPRAAFEAARSHERHISGRIDTLMALAVDEKDFATQNYLQWFVGEQVEEEANAEEIVRKLELVGDGAQGLFMMDRELAARVFTPPPTSSRGS